MGSLGNTFKNLAVGAAMTLAPGCVVENGGENAAPIEQVEAQESARINSIALEARRLVADVSVPGLGEEFYLDVQVDGYSLMNPPVLVEGSGEVSVDGVEAGPGAELTVVLTDVSGAVVAVLTQTIPGGVPDTPEVPQ